MDFGMAATRNDVFAVASEGATAAFSHSVANPSRHGMKMADGIRAALREAGIGDIREWWWVAHSATRARRFVRHERGWTRM